MQVGQLSAAELAARSWPSGEGVAHVAEAVSLILPTAQRLILDLKPLVRLGGSAMVQLKLAEQAAQMLAGRPQDVEQLANATVQLVESLGCTQCLVWSKEDELIACLHELRPELLLGYVSLPAEQDVQAKPPFRLQYPQVRCLFSAQLPCSMSPSQNGHRRLRHHHVHRCWALSGPPSLQS